MINACNIRTGTEITCRITNQNIRKAKLNIENGILYVCQDIRNGNRCIDTLGFKYSWVVGEIPRLKYDIEDFFENVGVSCVTLLKAPDWDTEANR